MVWPWYGSGMSHFAPVVACGLLLLACSARRAPPASTGPSGGAERIIFVEGTAGRLRVSDGGSGGTPVVLVHGLGSDLEVWRAQLDHLRAGRRAIAYDQRGHGGSERARDGVYTIEALADDLEAVRRALGLERMVLVGHSMSGQVLTTYAGARPDRVAGLFYLDALGDAHAFPRAEVAAVVARETAPTFGAADRRAAFDDMLKEAKPATRQQVLASLDRIDPPAFGLLRKAMFELVDAAARYAPYHGPAVALEEGDRAWPGSASAVLGVRRIAIHGVSHWIQLDDPAGVSREIDAFLAGLPAER